MDMFMWTMNIPSRLPFSLHIPSGILLFPLSLPFLQICLTKEANGRIHFVEADEENTWERNETIKRGRRMIGWGSWWGSNEIT